MYSKLKNIKNNSAINTRITVLNYRELIKLAEFADNLGFFISFIPLHASTTGDFIIRKKCGDLLIPNSEFSEFDRIIDKIVEMKKVGTNIYNSTKYLNGIKKFLRGEDTGWRCESPYLYFSISPSGNFLPCVDLKSSYSMLDKNFYENYISGEIIKKTRVIVDNCPKCYYACWPEFSYFFSDLDTFIEQSKLFFRKRFMSKKFFEFSDFEEFFSYVKSLNLKTAIEL